MNKPVRNLIIGWMTYPDYTMMVNEQPQGGFKWEFLDFKPTQEDRKDFNTPIFIYREKQFRDTLSQDEIEELRKDKARLNWMIENFGHVYKEGSKYFVHCDQLFQKVLYISPRAAIDAAMERK